MNTFRLSRITGALLALSAVLLGAFGAHALKATLVTHDAVATWETAVRYQMWHALALLLLSAISTRPRTHCATSICFTMGTLLFSGSLYGLALDGPRWLGPITPLGGLCLIIGWSLLVYTSIKHKPAQ